MDKLFSHLEKLQKQKKLLLEINCETLCKGTEFSKNNYKYCCIHEKELIDTEIKIRKVMNDNPQIYSVPEKNTEIYNWLNKITL
jgi:hypothetical protein